MATTFRIKCINGNHEATLEIVDSVNPLPGSDSWKCLQGTAVWGDDPQGSAANWGGSELFLHSKSGIHLLREFNANTKIGETGTGHKQPVGGSFPYGDFNWQCTSVL